MKIFSKSAAHFQVSFWAPTNFSNFFIA